MKFCNAQQFIKNVQNLECKNDLLQKKGKLYFEVCVIIHVIFIASIKDIQMKKETIRNVIEMILDKLKHKGFRLRTNYVLKRKSVLQLARMRV